MSYSEKVLDHYENPRNVGAFEKGDETVGTGMVGAPACGDVMKLQIKVGADGVIQDAKFKTYGCGSAIASSSLVTEWVKGKTLDQALSIKNTQIAEELALPPVKIHCSILAEDAIKAAVQDYKAKHISRYMERRGKGLGLRLGVRTTGCSGLAYKLEYVDEETPEDQMFESRGIRVYVDPKSLPYIDGTELDFAREGLNEGFKFQNPNMKDECGCGESFRI